MVYSTSGILQVLPFRIRRYDQKYVQPAIVSDMNLRNAVFIVIEHNHNNFDFKSIIPIMHINIVINLRFYLYNMRLYSNGTNGHFRIRIDFYNRLQQNLFIILL